MVVVEVIDHLCYPFLARELKHIFTQSTTNVNSEKSKKKKNVLKIFRRKIMTPYNKFVN